MDPNLRRDAGFKELFFKKLSYSLIWSVTVNLLIVVFHIVFANFNINPVTWFWSTFNSVTSLSTLLYLLMFTVVIVAQIMACAKNYVLTPPLQANRFKKLLSIFAVRTIILVLLHLVIGGVIVWLYLSLINTPYRNLRVYCKDKGICVNEGSFFILLGGLWAAFFHFTRTNALHGHIKFPVIQQQKMLHFKANFFSILNDSRKAAFYPTIYYFCAYYIFGTNILNGFANSLNLGIAREQFQMMLYIYTWLFSIMYVFNMNLMQFFFELYLMEPIQHPILERFENDTTLADALNLNIPILQHLACLDLYLLSNWSLERRQLLYTLSQPGCHPYTWNKLFQTTTGVIQQFTKILNTSIALLTDEEPPLFKEDILGNSVQVLEYPHPVPIYKSIRNMSLVSVADKPTKVDPAREVSTLVKHGNSLVNKIKNLRLIKYVFEELPEAHVQHCFRNGQLIIWIAQGMANIISASIEEDPYGIVQKDVAALTVTLLDLKRNIKKLNKFPIFTKKNSVVDDFTLKMKNAVYSAVDRSLCNISKTFKNYWQDLNVDKDVLQEIQHYL